MPKNKLSDLRDHLFETLEALKDEEKPMDLDRAKAVSEVAGKIIDSAKVEVQFMQAVGEITDTDFFGKTIDGFPSDRRPMRLENRSRAA